MSWTGPRRLGLVAAAVAFVVLASTAPAIPIVWDEGEYLWRADRALAWFHLLFTPGAPDGGLHAFSHTVILDYWKFITWDEGHPGAGILPMIAVKALAGGALHTLTAARLGSILVFSAACGAVAYRLRKSRGTIAAVVAVVALLTLPRLFSEAHFATLDGQLTGWWLLLWAADSGAATSVGSAAGVGILAGLTAATKFTGWLAWGPLLVTRLLIRERRRQLALILIIPVALLTFYIVNPPLWHHPIASALQHVDLNVHRTLNVPVSFFGRHYDLQTRLPWYNTLVWLLIVTPVPLLVLGGIGLMGGLRRRDPLVISATLNFAVLMIARATPSAPPHDGVRLFITSFGFWCVLAGLGAQQFWDRSRTAWVARGPLLRAALVVALAAETVNLARYFPQTLSHYNLLVGGVRGAAALGFEPTYWWDALDDEVLGWINTHTDPGAKVAFSSITNIKEIRSWNRLRPAQGDRNRDRFQWFVLQNRTGFLGPSDHVLIETEQPAFVKYAGHRATGASVAPDLKVPLILIYTGDQYQAAVAAVTRKP